MDRNQKAASIKELEGVFADAGTVVVVHYSGLTVAEMTDLRLKLKAQGAAMKVVKNRLVKIAMKGASGDAGDKMFKGPVAIAYSQDPIASAKVVVQFAGANDKLKVIGAVMGNDVLNDNAVKALATLPSLDELRGKIIGLIQAPATKVAGVVQAPAGQLARVFAAYAKSAA